MNIIAKGLSMEASDVVEKGVDLYAKLETGLADAAKALWKLHEFHDDAYLAGIITGTEAMQGKAHTLQIMGTIGEAQRSVILEHIFAAKKAEDAGVDIATPYAPLPPRTTRSVGR